jgi:hypothetical protein
VPRKTELIVCGWDEVFILDPDHPDKGKLWSWRAADVSTW